MHRFNKSAWLGLAAIVTLGTAAPAAAEMYSDGHKFLEAVEKKENNTVISMLSGPGGSVLINSRDLATERTALHIAASRRDEAWIRFLLGHGANPNLADNKGVTPLLLACRIGFMPGVEALVKNGARVDEPNEAGETPLISAVHSRNIELAKVLLAAGADPDHADNSGRTARDYARLENAANVLAELDRKARPKGQRGGDAYGPSF